MKVVIINPWQPIYNHSGGHLGIDFPLPAMYAAAVAEKAGHNVVLMDAYAGGCTPFRIKTGGEPLHLLCFQGENIPIDSEWINDCTLVGSQFGGVETAIRRFAPEVVGISAMFTAMRPVLPIITAIIHHMVPNAKIVVGGSFATLQPEIIMRECGCVDYTVSGEAEVSFPSLLEEIELHVPRPQIPGVSYREDEKVVVPKFDVLPDAAGVLHPAYHMLPIDQYFGACGYRRTSMITSRGCPYDCAFCSVPYVSRRLWKPHPIGTVLAELAGFKEGGITQIFFEDDNIAVDKNRFITLLEEIIKAKWGYILRAHNGIHVSSLNKEILRLMRLAGLEWVVISPETGCERVAQEEIGKTFIPSDAERVLKQIVELDMKPLVNLVIGFPGETMREIEMTADYARSLKTQGAQEFQIAIAYPLPHSRMYEQLVAEGRLDEKAHHMHFYEPSFDGPDWTRGELKIFRGNLAKELNG